MFVCDGALLASDEAGDVTRAELTADDGLVQMQAAAGSGMLGLSVQTAHLLRRWILNQ
jgi:hypothetical protein